MDSECHFFVDIRFQELHTGSTHTSYPKRPPCRMGGCDLGMEVNPSGGADDCQEFNNTAMDDVLDPIPEAASAVVPDAEPDSPAERVIPGYESAVRKFFDAGIKVIGVRDNLRFAKNKATGR